MTTNNHPAHGPVSLDRLHQIREHLLHDTQYSNGGNRAYILADVLKVIDGAIARELVRREHAAWSQATFGDVGPVGPLKHLSKEALEAAAEPGDLSEWADMQFLLWDAQRRAGISDAEITAAMENKLKINMERQWPEPKDGEPRLHIKDPGNSPVTPDGWISCSERMPNDAQWCVVNTEYGYYVQCWSEGQGWLGDDISIPECDVINWMPLPEPPQEVK